MKRALKLVGGLLVSLAFVWLSLRGKDMGAVWRQLREADYLYLVPYFAILLVIHVVRTIRWGKLIEPLQKVSFARLNAVCAVGFMALVLLPFRLGELARPYLIREKGKISGTAAMASVVVERVLDGLIVAALLIVLLLRIPGESAQIRWVRAGGDAMFAFFATLFVFLVVAYWQKPLALRFARATLGRVAPAFCERLCGMLEAFIDGLRALPGWRSLASIVFLTCVYWGINAWGMQILGYGFGIRLGYVQSLTVLGVLVIGVMIPAGPGMAGTFQYFCGLGLALFLGRDATGGRGTAYANVLWASQFVQQVALGVVFLFSRHLGVGHRVTFGELMHAEEAMGDEPAAAPAPSAAVE